MLGRSVLFDDVELYDLNARYYDPSIARFLTEDPYYNLGNRVMGVYEINVPNVYSIMQDNSSDHGPNNSHYSGGYNERKTDSHQLRLIVDYNLDLDCFISEAVRLNTDNMIYVDNLVKINKPENSHNPNNFVTFAYSPNIDAVLQSNNLYVYAINNSIMYTDEFGTDVHVAELGVSLGIGLYVGLKVAVVWDDEGNTGVQPSFSAGGGIGASAGGDYYEFSNLENIEDLNNGASLSTGGGVGPFGLSQEIAGGDVTVGGGLSGSFGKFLPTELNLGYYSVYNFSKAFKLGEYK